MKTPNVKQHGIRVISGADKNTAKIISFTPKKVTPKTNNNPANKSRQGNKSPVHNLNKYFIRDYSADHALILYNFCS